MKIIKNKPAFIPFLALGMLLLSIVVTVFIYIKLTQPSAVIDQAIKPTTQIQISTKTNVITEPQKTLSESIKNTPLVAVLPHHNVVKTQRDTMLQQLSTQAQPPTIILLSPNHFSSGSADIITAQQDWTVKNGQSTITTDNTIINGLVKNNLASNEPNAFTYEHGIKNLLGEIKQYWPQAQLVPIIFKADTSPEALQQLTDWLLTNCPDCGVLASVDMSHYQPAAVADIHDIKTLRALQTLDDEEIWQAEVDSNVALAFLVQWAQQQNLHTFNLSAHTNSSALLNDVDTESTSHIMGYYTADTGATAAAPPDNVTFTFAGDGMFGREIGYQFQNNDFTDLFSELGDRTFWGTDIAWINLEGPVSDTNLTQDRQPADLVFNFSRQTMAALQYLKLTAVGLGNNHTYNQGQAGLDTTRQLLDEARIARFGNPIKVSADESVYHYPADPKPGAVTISMIALNALENTAGIEELIQQEKTADNFVIVLPHWGNEYQLTHSTAQENMARAWLAAGADLIIGSHPHVIQDAQIIDGKLVFYSLGNFVFDQSFSEETQQGLLLTGVIEADQIKIVLVPLDDHHLKPSILQGTAKQKIINHVCSNIQEYCQNGTITLTRQP